MPPILLALGLVLALSALAWYAIAMPGKTFAGDLPPVTPKEQESSRRLQGHVERLASDIGERSISVPGSLNQAADYIEETLTAFGYSVESQQYRVSDADVRNLAAERLGVRRPEDIVVVGAHYDSVYGCPGANDNATGVAAVLELARLFANRKMERTVRFLAFVNEEPPFFFSKDMGSRVYAQRCRQRRENIAAMLSLETIGYYSNEPGSQRYPFPFGLVYPKTGNFIAFVGNMSSRSLVRRCVASFRSQASFPCEGTAAPGYIPGIYWSDHWAFWREGYAAVMVTDTAPFRYPHYHTSLDTPDKVDFGKTARVVTGLATLVQDLARS